MPIISCPQCQKQLQLPEAFAGREVQCPGCKNIFAPPVDRPSSAPPPPPPGDRFEQEDYPRPSRHDDDYDAPRRRRSRDDDYDDYDDRPIRRRLKPHRGSTIQILGILSIFVATPILGPMAWIMGSNDLREMDEGIMDPSGRSETQLGKTIGMVMTIIMLFVIPGCLFFICLGTLQGPRGVFR